MFTVPGLDSAGASMHSCCEFMNIPFMSCIEGIFFLYTPSSTLHFISSPAYVWVAYLFHLDYTNTYSLDFGQL